jgi:radical SAM superfamily enzyme YgiQ (UPF0313 family)
MKAVLIHSPPYNIALLKAVCRQQGHAINCLDLNIKFYNYLTEEDRQHIYRTPTNWYSDAYVEELFRQYPEFVEQCTEEIISNRCNVVGFTVTGVSISFSREIAKRIKNNDRKKIIVFGGPSCFKTEWGKRLLYTSPYIDVVCSLEGENVFPHLLTLIEQKGKIEFVKGMAFRDGGGKAVDYGDVELVNDLNQLPFADYSDFNLQDYSDKELPISTSRGCINRCTFCSESKIWKRYRFRSANNVFAEMKHHISKYPFITSFFFNDSLLNGNIRMLDALCDLLIQNKIHIYWGGQAAIREEMTKKLILKMKKTGFSHVSYGLETVSSRMLRKIGKHFSPQLAERVIRDTKSAGVRTDVNIIVGFPEETHQDIMETARFLKRNKRFIDEIFFHPLVISPGSYYYEHRDEMGIKFEDEFNPNSWYSTKEENNLDKRLEILKFYKSYIGNKGESFFTLGDYYLFIADVNFNKSDYKNALIYYKKAKEVNENRLKDEFIKEKIGLAQRKTLI